MSAAVVIFCTCPSEDVAGRLAREIVDQRHAACVNILPSVRSVYRWEDEVQEDMEVLMMIKTTEAHFFVIEHWLQENHPYDVPEVVALPARHVSDAYLHWLRSSVDL